MESVFGSSSMDDAVFCWIPCESGEESENTVKDTFDVIMAGYQSIEPAKKNFEAFVKLI